MYLIIKYVDGGAALITLSDGRGGLYPFTIVGTSLPISALPGEKVSTLSIYPQKGKNGVLALAYYNKQGELGAILSGVRWKGDKFEVSDGHGSDHFVNPSRVSQMYTDDSCSWIEVQINNRRFTSNPARTNSVTHLVTDNNLLCQFIAGDVGPDAVIHAAIESKKELTIKQLLDQAQKEVAKARQNVRDITNRHAICLATLLVVTARLRARWFLSKADKVLLNSSALKDIGAEIGQSGRF